MAKITIGDVKKYVESESDSGCLLLSSHYTNSKTKLEFKCSCGNVFSRRYDSFKQGNFKCTECSGRKKWDYNSVKTHIESKSNSVLISFSFTKVKNLLDIKCECGNTFSRSFQNMKDKENYVCDVCLGKELLDYKSVKFHVESKSCKLLSTTYENCQDRLLIKCVCGKEFARTFTKFKHYNQIRCASCSKSRSKAEEEIARILDSLRASYIEEYPVQYENKRLRYDFFIEDSILLEYDGEDHYMIVNRTSDKEYNRLQFEKRQAYDRLKDEYCDINNIPLIRIPYWEKDNLENIINSIVKDVTK